MTKLIYKDNSIEGKKIEITTRKVIPQNIVKINEIRFFKHLCKKNVKATIKEELEPKKYKLFKKSKLDRGDEVTGDTISIYADSLLEFKKEANYSSRHGIQTSTTKRFGCAEIQTPFRCFTNPIIISK